MASKESFVSALWREQADAGDPFSATECRCSGFDVYGDLLGKISLVDYIFLMFKNEAPTPEQTQCLNDLSVAIACLGPRDLATQAATSAAAGGSPMASCLMASLSVSAGQYGGAREVLQVMECIHECEQVLERWQQYFSMPWPRPSGLSWPDREHPAGYDPNVVQCSKPVLQSFQRMVETQSLPMTAWCFDHRQRLETMAGMPMAMTTLVGAVLHDLGFHPQQGEMLYLVLRMPGIAALALEQHWTGFQHYPFHKEGLHLQNDPGFNVGGE